MKPIITSLLAVVLFGGLSQAQEAEQYALEDAVAFAIKHNYQLQQARIDLEISKRKVKETTAIGLPQVNGEASYNNYIDIPTQVAEASAFDPTAPPDVLVPLQFGLPHSMTAGITASQLLFDGSYFVGLKAAKEYVKSTEYSVQRSEREVEEAVKQAYYTAAALMENMQALKENQVIISKIASDTRAMHEAGFLEQQDADQVMLMESNINYQLDYTQRQYDNMLKLLKFQMGLPVSEPIQLSDSLHVLIENQMADGTQLLDQNFSASRHIDFITVNQGLRLTELSLANERARYYPQLSAFFNHSQNAFRKEFNFLENDAWYPTTLWGVQLRVPIFSSLQGHQRVAQAKLELSKVQSQKLQVEESLSMQASSARADYQSALERFETVKADLNLAESIKKSTQAKYNQGVASSMDLSNAENQYLSSLANYINTSLELLNAKLTLEQALGN